MVTVACYPILYTVPIPHPPIYHLPVPPPPQGGPSINVRGYPLSNEIPQVDCLWRPIYTISLIFRSKPVLMTIIIMVILVIFVIIWSSSSSPLYIILIRILDLMLSKPVYWALIAIMSDTNLILLLST